MGYKIIDKKTDTNQNNEFLAVLPKWGLDEIILPNEQKEELKELIAFSKRREEIIRIYDIKKYTKSDSIGIAVNFYGVPGTGKSITAEAIAKELNMKIIKVDYSQVAGRLKGDTEKSLSNLFKQAEQENQLLFFDEADAVLSKRVESASNGSDQGSNQIKSHLLTLLDRSNVIVIFATNFFQNYDSAFLRRILFHVEFKIPDQENRKQILQFHLNQGIPKEISYEDMAILTDGLSGGDIKNIALKIIIKLATNSIELITKANFSLIIKNYHKSMDNGKVKNIHKFIKNKE